MSKDYIPNLKGIMIGNGVTHWKHDCEPAFFEMTYSHGLLDPEVYFNIKSECPDMWSGGEISDECAILLNHFYGLVESVNIYDIYGKCYGLQIQSTKSETLKRKLALM